MRALLVIAVVVSMASFARSAEPIAGRAEVIDGDTLAIQGRKERIRLYGMDAPESGQTCDDASGKRYLCGSRAADYLAQLIGRGGSVKCFAEDRDRYGRIVAECSAADGRTVLNAAMIDAGWAVEYRQYSDGRYEKEEADAKANKRGLWTGAFVTPSEWRRGARLPDENGNDIDTEIRTGSIAKPTGKAPSAECRIKGNVGGSGRIYHMPGQGGYEATRIDTAKGERWFCSPKEADAAGWRPARR